MDYTDYLFLIGRILYGGYFLMAGLNHFLKADMMTGYAASKGVPMPGLLVPFSGLFIILGGLGILLGVYIQWAVLFIAIFLIVISVKMHAYWSVSDPMAKMGDQVNFLKNMALLGAGLMFLAIPEPWLWGIL